MMACDRLTHHLGLFRVYCKVAVDQQPVHFTVSTNLVGADNRDIVF